MPVSMPSVSSSALVEHLQIVSLQNVLVVAWVLTASIVAIAIGVIV